MNALERSHSGSALIVCADDGLDRRFEKAVIFQFPKVML
jgi:hypothetical protein